MNTLSEIWGWLSIVLAAIVLISNAAEKIAIAIKAAKAPESRQNEDIQKLKADVKEIKEKLKKDDDRLNDSQNANRITQEALLALLEHGLNGNNVEQMNTAKKKLHNYLINH